VDALELAHKIIDAITEKKAEQITLLDLRHVTPIADYFVIASGDNDRLLNAISDNVRVKVKEVTKTIPTRTDGKGESGWVLMDYGDVVVHIFSPKLRAYYDLESLWADAKVLLRVQ
jgi:ribosome-associated protein